MGTLKVVMTAAALTLTLTACADGNLTPVASLSNIQSETSASQIGTSSTSTAGTSSASTPVLSNSNASTVYGDDALTPLWRGMAGQWHVSGAALARPEGILGGVFQNGSPTRVQLFSCAIEYDAGILGRQKRNFFSSTDANCEGQVRVNRSGDVYIERAPTAVATKALYRCSACDQHLDSTNTDECVGAGFNVEGILGYIQ